MRSASGPITQPKWRHDLPFANPSQSVANNLAIPSSALSIFMSSQEVSDYEFSRIAEQKTKSEIPPEHIPIWYAAWVDCMSEVPEIDSLLLGGGSDAETGIVDRNITP